MNKLVLHIKTVFWEILKNIYWLEINLEELIVEIPPKKEMWDYTFSTFLLAKNLKKSPVEIWQEIIDCVEKNKEKYNIFSNLELAWPHLNFRLDKDIFSKIFIDNSKDFIENKIYSQEIVIVDYVWINVWKPLHIGHICPSLQWQFLVNIYKKLWAKVIWDTHIWDWGIIFGKLILAYKLWWDEKKLKENAVNHLFELYVKISNEVEKEENLEEQFRQEFKKLSLWDKDSIELWKEFTRHSIDSMQVQLDRLWIKADYNIWESFYEWLNLPKMEDYPDLKWNMKEIVEELTEKWIATKNTDSSVWVIFPDETKLPSCVLQKRDWTHGYLASDLACIKYRMDNWNPIKILYSIDVRQQLHFKQVFEISKMAWWLDKNTELFHAYFWFISLKDWAISTRKWRIIKLDALLDEAENRAKNIILEKREDFNENELNNLAKIVWIWAIKYGYLSKNRTIDTIFDWDEFMSFEWNSWPYIQYTYVRAKQILKNWDFDFTNLENLSSFDFDEEIDLAKELFNYKNILIEASQSYNAHIVCNYIYNITKKFNTFYNKVHIISEENKEKRNLKLLLVYKFSEILKDAFQILGIEMPERM